MDECEKQNVCRCQDHGCKMRTVNSGVSKPHGISEEIFRTMFRYSASVAVRIALLTTLS